MSGWTKYHQNIQAQLGALPRRVLVLEGSDDKTFIESLLTRRQPGAWQASWVLGEAGGKGNVLKILAHEPTWQGLIDRDEWTSKDVLAQQAAFPNRLHVLPRYCMESYFVVPEELWLMLDSTQQARVPGARPAFDAPLLSPLPQWVRHGALWHAINPLWAGLKSMGFQDDLLDFTNAQQNETAIAGKLQQWHTYLDPQPILLAFQTNLSTAQTATSVTQLTQWVHAKKFFEQHANQTLCSLLGVSSQPPKVTLAKLQQRMALPTDLQPIWTAIGLP